jgi:hypothetical protein
MKRLLVKRRWTKSRGTHLDVIPVLAPVKACQSAAAVDFPAFLVRVPVARRVEKIDGSRLRRYSDSVAVAIERDGRQWNGAHANSPKMRSVIDILRHCNIATVVYR